MKKIKGIIALVAFFAINNAFGGGMPQRQSNFERFITTYRGDVIDTGRNLVAPAWVYEATNALRADGMTDLRDPNMATLLWRSIENVINYYASLPQNRNNTQFTTRMWQSLTRSLDELARTQQPMTRHIVQQPVMQSGEASVSNGVAELKNLRLKTAQIIQTNPTYFYSAGVIQPSWLKEALYAITARGRTPMTMQNKLNITEEVKSAVVELMRQILRADARNLSEQQKNMILQMASGQVEMFIANQIASGNKEVIAISQNQGYMDQGLQALRNFKMQTAQTIETNPTYFYSAGVIQPAWLQEAIKRITADGKISLTMQNKMAIQQEIAGTADELMRQVLRKDPRNLSTSQKENILKMIRGQVEQFITTRVMRSRI